MKRVKEILEESFLIVFVSIIKCLVGGFIVLLLQDSINEMIENGSQLNFTYWGAFKCLLFFDCLVNLFTHKTISKDD
jgi:hypothetical protein